MIGSSGATRKRSGLTYPRVADELGRPVLSLIMITPINRCTLLTRETVNSTISICSIKSRDLFSIGTKLRPSTAWSKLKKKLRPSIGAACKGGKVTGTSTTMNTAANGQTCTSTTSFSNTVINNTAQMANITTEAVVIINIGITAVPLLIIQKLKQLPLPAGKNSLFRIMMFMMMTTKTTSLLSKLNCNLKNE